MIFHEDTLDDLMRSSIAAILSSGEAVGESSRGSNKELRGVLLKLSNPLARLSHTETKGRVFSPLGELSWYLSGRNDADSIVYYINKYKKEVEPDGTIHGAYGPRIFSSDWHNQFNNVVALLRLKPTTKKAVIQLFDSTDLCGPFKDVPCTCTLQFLIRGDRLNLMASMRSNDAYLGLPHDVFSFTMIQEIMSRMLGVDIGDYTHFAGSLHLYDKHVNDAVSYLDEGWQAIEGAAMAPMPKGDPWPALRVFLRAEDEIRRGEPPCAEVGSLDPYWQDLVRLLCVFRASRNQDLEEVERLNSTMGSRLFREFIFCRLRSLRMAQDANDKSG